MRPFIARAVVVRARFIPFAAVKMTVNYFLRGLSLRTYSYVDQVLRGLCTYPFWNPAIAANTVRNAAILSPVWSYRERGVNPCATVKMPLHYYQVICHLNVGAVVKESIDKEPFRDPAIATNTVREAAIYHPSGRTVQHSGMSAQ